ncbi:hypothetical protein EJ06DRAFT_527278 [Trichodelitschia bisporula]|uniref:Fe2OG dioxygenase domain-containing protein n=1 Tax=Trichodelitschia bisporula TaxID=703511 RepID=A0A6G1I5V0_9PEZI|nr:hypothetical protein EJ06DRAFT_527278 [Trichodelitschia bisporula]
MSPSTPLSAHRIPTLPESMYYIPNFISSAEESALLDKIPPNRWTPLAHRRLQAHPTSLHQGHTLLSLFAQTPHQAPNHCLINEYLPGQGIMPHEDGPAYAPLVATISLGSALVLDVYDKTEEGGRGERLGRVLCERGSLLVTEGEAYTATLHGIEGCKVDGDLGPGTVANWELLGDPEAFPDGKNERERRVSLTYRDVLRVAKIGAGILGVGRR